MLGICMQLVSSSPQHRIMMCVIVAADGLAATKYSNFILINNSMNW